ncbi:MAG: hypothetical protein JRJ47_10940 [Deltaproteobacteria bacterium]|nr:hypothetical protein [Deltaproteobacteria bacterium]
MKPIHKETEILEKALEKLRETTNLTVDIQPYGLPDVDDRPHMRDLGAYHRTPAPGPDTAIRIIWQDMEWHFITELKPRITRPMVGVLAQQLHPFPGRRLVVARYVTPQIADQLRELDIPFIDTVGNAYINVPPLFVFVKGNRPIDILRAEPFQRAFRPAGLKVIFALLCNPQMEEVPFRFIANAADVALGTVGWVMRDLKKMGHLVDFKTRGRRLIRKDELLGRWVTTYPEQLRPKQLIGRYRAEHPDWWRHTAIKPFDAYWGGEIAAARLTRHLKPEMVTIYTIKEPAQLLLTNRIRKHPQGDIEILKAFWKFDEDLPRHQWVHPILVYADLMATADPRNIEVAKMIYEQELPRFIRED